jgi:hypothetical protein
MATIARRTSSDVVIASSSASRAGGRRVTRSWRDEHADVGAPSRSRAPRPRVSAMESDLG